MTVDVRNELDQWLPQGPEACFNMMLEQVRPLQDGSEKDASLGNLRRTEVAEQMQKVREYFECLGWDEARPEVEAMTRYFFEGMNRNGEGYQEDSQVYDALGVGEFLDRGGSLIDLGAGPGRYLRSRPAGQVLGVDISPTFALANPRVQCGTIDAPFETFMEQVNGNLPLARPRWVVSSLTMDRVRDPRVFLSTMSRLGNKITVATLLPIVPVDDGPCVKNRITYTPEKLRLTPGATEEEDRRILQTYLEDTFQGRVEAQNVPYVCRSSDGVQTYENYWAFNFDGQL